MDDQLKKDDELKKLEEIIWKNHGTEFYCEKGRALKNIRDKKLYKNKYKNFKTYCRDKWDMSRSGAYQLIDAFDVVENVQTCGQIPPAFESHARPLTKLTPEQQCNAWNFIVKNAPNGRITSKYIKKIVSHYLEENAQKKQPLTDGIFYHIFEAFSICKKVGKKSNTIKTDDKFSEFLTNCKDTFGDKMECSILPDVFRIVFSNEHCRTMFSISRSDNGNFQETGSNQFKQATDFDPSAILGVKDGASKNEIKRAYRSLSKMYHTDTLGRLNIDQAHRWIIEEAENRMKYLNWAYEQLRE